ncbi:uncharacterized protein LOC123564334 [Mercenaria mercenaria]|uniref:uncharacterized protein LOC123564334 n=1 Tax=Mercenaria mercenaria TaxID=6596 RepID=UPI00234EAD5D|nr:uncharacterized protein LOC123564334 [Mercenaria mercenaria]
MDSSLSQLIAAHDNTERELITFDDSVTSLSQKIFSASNQSENLRLLLRLSVTEGVQDMYTQFHNKTKQQVLEKSQLETDITIMEHTTAMLTPSRGGNTKTDKAAGIWTSAYCEFYRGS